MKYLKFHDVTEDQIIDWVNDVIKPTHLSKSLNWWFGNANNYSFWYNSTHNIAWFGEDLYTVLAVLTFETTTTTRFE